MYFPLELPLGKHIPLYGSIPGRSFRLRHHPETTSQSERGFRDGLSAWAAIGKACPGLRCQGVFFTAAPCIEFDSPRFGACVGAGHGQPELNRHRIYIWSRLCAENLRICFANTHRLRPPVGALAGSLRTLRVRLTLAPSRVRVPPASKRSEPASLRKTGSKAPYGRGGGTRTHNPCGERF